MADEDPLATIAKAVESARSVKLGRGVVGKTGHIALFVLVVWAIVLWRWSSDLAADAGLVLVAMIPTLFALWFIAKTHGFAERNPSLALLEGAEFLEWHKLGLQVKGLPEEAKPVLIEDKGSKGVSDALKL